VTVAERRGLALVAIAVLFFSTSPVLVRWAARSVSSFEIAAGSLLVAGMIVSGVVLLRSRGAWGGSNMRGLLSSNWPRLVLVGLVAALHFFFYAYSLEFTTITNSLAIMYTAPIWVALLSRFALREPLSKRKWLGILVAVLGVAVLSGFEPVLAFVRQSGSASYNFTSRTLIGDLLALGSAVTYALYSIAGRSQRERFPLLLYAGAVYLLAALWLLPAAAATHTPGSFSWPAVASIVALGVFPLACGHTLYNAALRRVNATYVNLIATQEVLGGVLLGALLLREIPSFNSIVGGLITIGGILMVLL